MRTASRASVCILPRYDMTDCSLPLVVVDQPERSYIDVLKSEFRRTNFGFDYETSTVFVSSQWPPLRRLFVVYRLLVASYALTVTFVSIQLHPRSLLPWPVWLTNWSYFLLTCHLLCAALIVLLNACFECQSAVPPAYDSTSIPCYIKLNWFLFSVATPAAVVVTTVFFTSIFPRLHQDYLNAENANLHVMNTVLVILEFTVSAFPVRMLHMVYVWLYGLAYLIFSTIYWAVDHSNVMYPGVLDWNVPITTAVVILVLFVIGIPLVQFILFNIYQLRLYIYTPACRQFHG